MKGKSKSPPTSASVQSLRTSTASPLVGQYSRALASSQPELHNMVYEHLASPALESPPPQKEEK
jgi:hypothetical protein